MKVVLSRKGFDSSDGGFASPILENGSMISLPIPVTYRVEDHRIHYSDVRFDDNSKVIDFLAKIGYASILVSRGQKSKWRCLRELSAHLDPDLCRKSYPRERGWRGLFGMNGDCQKEIDEEGGLDSGDLFLFFGWFEKYRRDKNDGFVRVENRRDYRSGRHVIFGYLQIDKIIRLSDLKASDSSIKKWMDYHPHIGEKRKIVGDKENFDGNTLYVARRSLDFSRKPGFGVFRYTHCSQPYLTLTKKGCSRSKWTLPRAFTTPRQVEISRNPHGWDTWGGKEGYFQSADRGQEFLIEECTGIEKWAKSLVSRFG